MKKSLIIISLLSTPLVFAESIYDGTGSLINPNKECWGCDKDEARMHPHSDASKNSTVTFQWLYDPTKCHHIDIHSEPNLNQDVQINLKSWHEKTVAVSYKARLPVGSYDVSDGVSINNDAGNLWTTLAITTTRPINQETAIYAYCKSVSDSLNTQNLTKISSAMTRLDHGRSHLGNGSLISTAGDNGQGGFGTIKDAAVTSNNDDAETTFQIYSKKESCEEITIRDKSGSSKVEAILHKGWSDSKWKLSACDKLPCTVKAYFRDDGKPEYSIINVQTKAGNNDDLYAFCGTKDITFNLKEKEVKLRHPNGCKFDDVKKDHWGHKYITALCSSQIIVGYAHTGFTKYGPDNPALWSELTAVVNLSNNFYKTKKIRAGYPQEPWWQAYINIAKEQGFYENSQTEVSRGKAFNYVVSVFWGEKLSESESANFLRNKGVINNTNTSKILTRAEMAKIVLISSTKSANDSAIARKLPYINHTDKNTSLDNENDIPKDVFKKPKSTDSDSKKDEIISDNVKKSEIENNTVSDGNHTDNTGLVKAVVGGEKNMDEKYQGENAEEIASKAKQEGISEPVNSNSKLKEASVVEIKTYSGETIIAPTTKEKDSAGNNKILIEKEHGEVISATKSEVEQKLGTVVSQFPAKKLLRKGE